MSQTSGFHSGKKFEKDLENWLTQTCPTYNIHFHRLPDSFAARGRRSIPPQPADWQFVVPGGIHFYMEVKQAGKKNGEKFALWKLSDEQYRVYEESVYFRYNWLSLNFQQASDTLYLVPSWMLKKEERRKGDKTLDLSEIAEKFPWIVLNSKEDIIDRLLNEPLLRFHV